MVILDPRHFFFFKSKWENNSYIYIEREMLGLKETVVQMAKANGVRG